MKRYIAIILSIICISSLVGCENREPNYVSSEEPGITNNSTFLNNPSIAGIVEEVHEKYIIIYIQTEGYPNGADCKVSLNVEHSDAIYSPITVGDYVVVYYNGAIAESNPLQINTVYAILLKEHADCSVDETT